MKLSPILLGSAIAVLPHLASATDTIRLSEPVSQSVKPDLLYWSFDNGKAGETTPNPSQDDSGNGLDGYLLPGKDERFPTYVAGRFGTAISIPRGSPTALDARVNWNATDNPGSGEGTLDLDGKSFTAGAWVRFPNTNPETTETFVLFERGHSAAERSFWSLTITKTEQGKWHLQVHLPGAFKTFPVGSVVLDDGEWHHVAFTLEPSGENNSVTSVWLDGAPLAENVPIESVIPPADPNDRLFTVGERNIHFHTSSASADVDDVFVTTGTYRFEP